MQPTDEEVEKACREESDALRAFAKISAQETKATVKKKAARLRLTIARDTKRALLDDLMTL